MLWQQWFCLRREHFASKHMLYLVIPASFSV
jgi:hypothetical protein